MTMKKPYIRPQPGTRSLLGRRLALLQQDLGCAPRCSFNSICIKPLSFDLHAALKEPKPKALPFALQHMRAEQANSIPYTEIFQAAVLTHVEHSIS